MDNQFFKGYVNKENCLNFQNCIFSFNTNQRQKEQNRYQMKLFQCIIGQNKKNNLDIIKKIYPGEYALYDSLGYNLRIFLNTISFPKSLNFYIVFKNILK
jgi:hypothetical protein